jgi:hypothetical protein
MPDQRMPERDPLSGAMREMLRSGVEGSQAEENLLGQTCSLGSGTGTGLFHTPDPSGQVHDSLAWKEVIRKSELMQCGLCDEPVCPRCMIHFYDCHCVGENLSDHEYKTERGILLARRIETPAKD